MGGISRWKKTLAARLMRANATPAESLLWKRLRGGRPEGFKFRRQAPLGDYIADFFCAEAKLVVEVDGSIHLLRAGQDAIRTEWLEQNGLRVARFSNDEVLKDVDEVVRRIVVLCRDRTRNTP